MPRLRQEIAAEVPELKKKTRFCLVFEGHQPCDRCRYRHLHRIPVSI